ncbi:MULTISPECIES: hypothetical protein, partial [unclassified Pseudomonas]|uniref:hypothetical protein n=1 Tax=unclassified Pseudomonas TaxID=196821 RepID=UPI003F9AE04E
MVDTGLASLCVVFGVQAAYRRSADVFGFALPGESLLRAKVTKTHRPVIRPWLRQGSLTPSSLQRPAAVG